MAYGSKKEEEQISELGHQAMHYVMKASVDGVFRGGREETSNNDDRDKALLLAEAARDRANSKADAIGDTYLKVQALKSGKSLN